MNSAAATSSPTACRLVGVGKQFGGVWACRNVSLDAIAGEVHALLGENGAGKSTLMKMLHGVHQPDEGYVEVGGQRVTLTSPRAAESSGIGMVPQELDLFPDLSVVENLFVGRQRPRSARGTFDRARMRSEASQVFQRLDARIDIDASVSTLSGANAQMVAIARALLHDARVLIFDEPTAALTESEAQRLFAIIRDLTARGVAILYISHRLDEVFQIARRITVLRDGQWIHTGAAQEMDTDRLIQLMVGRPISKLFHRSAHPAGDVLLEVRNLGQGRRFDNVTFSLRRGEIVGLAGLIGAGRSEVCQAIFGLERDVRGEILVNGVPVRIRSAGDALRLGIVYVPEERRSQGLMLGYDMRWNMSFTALKRIAPRGFIERRLEDRIATDYRDLFAIRGDGAGPVLTLSGGNQQKVLLAKSLAIMPDVILLDEPTRGVDVGAKAEIYRIIDDLAGAGKAVLMVSSEMNELLSMSDRILVMHEGSMTGSFAGPDYSTDAIAAAAAGVDRPEVRH